MSVLNVSCSHCSRVTRIPAAKVPDHPVSYRCPACKGKIVIDKQKLLGPSRVDAATSSSKSPAENAGPTKLPPPSIEVQELALPPGESLPPGFLVSEDDQLAEQLIDVLSPYDCDLERIEAVDTVRRRLGSDIPPLILYIAKKLGPPPYAALAPLLNLAPRDRRQTYLALIGADAPTLDGNQAFLFQVNLLINQRHIPKAAGILYSGLRYHQRLYRPYFEALGEDL